MAASTIGAIGVLALFSMLFARVPVWIALTLVGFVGNSIMSGVTPTFALAGTVPFDVGASYNLSVLPLFILMGEVASETGLSSDLFKAARVAWRACAAGSRSARWRRPPASARCAAPRWRPPRP